MQVQEHTATAADYTVLVSGLEGAGLTSSAEVAARLSWAVRDSWREVRSDSSTSHMIST